MKDILDFRQSCIIPRRLEAIANRITKKLHVLLIPLLKPEELKELLEAEVTKTMPPLLIEMQYLFDQDFMLRLIRYGSSTYDRYRVLPLILVIVTKGFSSTTFRREFTVSSNGFLLEVSCLLWAKQCLLLSAESINGHLNQATLDPMVALGYLVTNHPSCQMPPQHQANPTLMMLYSVAREILSKEESTKSEKANLI